MQTVKTYTFKVVVEPDEDRWHAYCPALEQYGAATWGNTEEEALRHINEVVQMVVEELVEASGTFPLGTLRSMIERQAQWSEDDLKRLGLLK